MCTAKWLTIKFFCRSKIEKSEWACFMGKIMYILEYYEEIENGDLSYDRYSLLGIFRTEKEAEEKRDQIIKEWELRGDTLYVSMIDIGNSQWEGGFISE